MNEQGNAIMITTALDKIESRLNAIATIQHQAFHEKDGGKTECKACRFFPTK